MKMSDGRLATIAEDMLPKSRVGELKDKLRSGELDSDDHQDLLRLIEQTEESARFLRSAVPDGW